MEEKKLLIIPASLPEYQDADVRTLMHFCYFHGTLEDKFGNDMFGVDMRSVTYDCYKNKDVAHYISKQEVAYFIEDKEYDQLHWFEVEVKGYDKPCMAIVQDYVNGWDVDIKNLMCFPRISHNGVIVDAEEWADGLEYVCRNSYHGNHTYNFEHHAQNCEIYSLLIRNKKEEALSLM